MFTPDCRRIIEVVYQGCETPALVVKDNELYTWASCQKSTTRFIIFREVSIIPTLQQQKEGDIGGPHLCNGIGHTYYWNVQDRIHITIPQWASLVSACRNNNRR